ncbi:MAG: DUF1800 domain-containing protein [Acidobacteriaceae bacterium]|nr:DUF1800 domain-containing protein [Acidobacteriaceae bacterium]
MKRVLGLRAAPLGAGLLVLLVPVSIAGGLNIKKLKRAANPPEYASFGQLLATPEELNHALDRLTFGARPGDLAKLRQNGLRRWLDEELHPERIPESPLLEERLAHLASLRMSIHETFTQYPPPQAIAAFARGRGVLPDDPELRAVIARLADRYLQKKNMSGTGIEPANNLNDTSDLDLKVKLSSILRPDQVRVLQNGTPEEKREVLASVPPEKQFDFAWALRPGERRELIPLAPVDLRRELMLTVNPQNVVASDLSEGKLLRAVYSNHQLTELLDDFWFNHFNIFLNKGGDRYMVPTYEREAIRPHIFGTFYELLVATAKSPAMLFYLDNWQSVSPEAAAHNPKTRKMERGLNENYGRELLELHTMGVDGGYTQKDVIEVARCFTGWTIAAPRKGGGFEYNDKVHDKGEKVVLGHVIRAGGGMNDGLEVLDILAHHPSTARFISLKLAQRFVADNPPPSLVNRMAKNFLKTGGDLRQLSQTMLTSPEFWSAGAYNAKVKTPFEMVASALRATNADVSSAYLLANELQKLGEPLYRKLEPTGYASANSEWVSSAALLERMNFALALANNRVPGVKVDTAAWQAEALRDPIEVARSVLEQELSEQTRAAIAKTISSEEMQEQLAQSTRMGSAPLPSLVAGLALGSPEFQRR